MKGIPKLFKIAWFHLRHLYIKLLISAQKMTLTTFIRKVLAQQTTSGKPILYIQEIMFLCLCVFIQNLFLGGGTTLPLGDILPLLLNPTLLMKNQISLMQLKPISYGLSPWGQKTAGHHFPCNKSSYDLNYESLHLPCLLPTQTASLSQACFFPSLFQMHLILKYHIMS